MSPSEHPALAAAVVAHIHPAEEQLRAGCGEEKSGFSDYNYRNNKVEGKRRCVMRPFPVFFR